MLEPLLILFAAIGITVVIAGLIVFVMVRTRRPPSGVREWIKESADYWQNEEHRAEAKRHQQAGVKQMHLEQLFSQQAKPAPDPLNEVNQLRTAASSLWEGEIERRRAARDAARKAQEDRKQAARDSLKEAQKADQEPVFPVGAHPVLPSNLPPSFAPRHKRVPKTEPQTSKFPVFEQVRRDNPESVLGQTDQQTVQTSGDKVSDIDQPDPLQIDKSRPVWNSVGRPDIKDEGESPASNQLPDQLDDAELPRPNWAPVAASQTDTALQSVSEQAGVKESGEDNNPALNADSKDDKTDGLATSDQPTGDEQL